MATFLFLARLVNSQRGGVPFDSSLCTFWHAGRRFRENLKPPTENFSKKRWRTSLAEAHPMQRAEWAAVSVRATILHLHPRAAAGSRLLTLYPCYAPHNNTASAGRNCACWAGACDAASSEILLSAAPFHCFYLEQSACHNTTHLHCHGEGGSRHAKTDTLEAVSQTPIAVHRCGDSVNTTRSASQLKKQRLLLCASLM